MTGAGGRLQELFDSVERGAWRWECQGYYRIDDAPLRRWRAGLPFEETDSGRAWHEYIRGLRRDGKTFERVRMLTEPLTEYLRWMVPLTQRNIDAGEDIRWITQTQARGLGLPTYDFYLFDDARLAIMRFGEEYLLDGLEVTDDADVVARHRQYRAVAWRAARPHDADLVGSVERST